MLSLTLLLVLMFFLFVFFFVFFFFFFFECVCFSVLFSIVITSFGEEMAGLYASCAFVCLSCMRFIFVFFSSSWSRGSAADCDCGTP